VQATNAQGNGPESVASNSVTPLGEPGAPTGVSAVGGNAVATVSFNAPADDGGSTITSFTATSSPGGITVTKSSSPITVPGLTNFKTYTFTVFATNAQGDGSESQASNSVRPEDPAEVVFRDGFE